MGVFEDEFDGLDERIKEIEGRVDQTSILVGVLLEIAEFRSGNPETTPGVDARYVVARFDASATIPTVSDELRQRDLGRYLGWDGCIYRRRLDPDSGVLALVIHASIADPALLHRLRILPGFLGVSPSPSPFPGD